MSDATAAEQSGWNNCPTIDHAQEFRMSHLWTNVRNIYLGITSQDQERTCIVEDVWAFVQ